MRTIGGLLYLSGALLMAFNVYKTIKGEVRETESRGVAGAQLAPAE